ncbi:MAG: hypothetical protein ACR2PH_15365, partial [Desulfobulbia bacterium]
DKYCDNSKVNVRSMVKRDLKRLLAKIGKPDREIIELPHPSYRYHIILKQQEWATYLSSEAMNLNYSTVRDTITDGLYERSEAYYACWTSLCHFQEDTVGV